MKHTRIVFCHCKRQIGEPIVQNGLALTPSDVLRAAEAGTPVSSLMQASNFSDGHTGSNWDIPLEDRRGIDIGHIYQEQMESRSKMRKAHKLGEVVESNSN